MLEWLSYGSSLDHLLCIGIVNTNTCPSELLEDNWRIIVYTIPFLMIKGYLNESWNLINLLKPLVPCVIHLIKLVPLVAVLFLKVPKKNSSDSNLNSGGVRQYILGKKFQGDRFASTARNIYP